MLKAMTIDSPIGPIGLIEQDDHLVEVLLDGLPAGTEEVEGEVVKQAARQLDEYFQGSRKQFDLPLMLDGTEFQLAVWSALQKIPYAETRSYQDIAITIGNPKAVRAVGGANAINRIPIIIPCHRVIGKSGKLVGFGGGLEGLEIKQFLINLERSNAADD